MNPQSVVSMKLVVLTVLSALVATVFGQATEPPTPTPVSAAPTGEDDSDSESFIFGPGGLVDLESIYEIWDDVFGLGDSDRIPEDISSGGVNDDDDDEWRDTIILQYSKFINSNSIALN